MKSPWDIRYANQEALYGKAPNAFFSHILPLYPCGSILLPCDGEGRNAIHAAKKGWDVHAFDGSQVGINTAQRWAAEANVAIQCDVSDAFDFAPKEQFDLVGLFYAHMPSERRRAFHHLAIQWLKPGGNLILEGFHTDQLHYQSGGPRNESMLFTPEMLAEDFKELLATQNEVVQVTLDEGPLHQGLASIVRYIGTK